VAHKRIKKGVLKTRSREVGQKIKAACRDAVRASLLEIESRAAQRAPVDTGSLRASIYVDWNGYAFSTLAGRDAPTKQAAFGGPPPIQTTEYKGFAAVGVEYGLYVHEGHIRLGSAMPNAGRLSDRKAGRWVAARPFLRQAGEEMAGVFLSHSLPMYMAKHGL
jgi:hypothetical protein